MLSSQLLCGLGDDCPNVAQEASENKKPPKAFQFKLLETMPDPDEENQDMNCPASQIHPE